MHDITDISLKMQQDFLSILFELKVYISLTLLEHESNSYFHVSFSNSNMLPVFFLTKPTYGTEK